MILQSTLKGEQPWSEVSFRSLIQCWSWWRCCFFFHRLIYRSGERTEHQRRFWIKMGSHSLSLISMRPKSQDPCDINDLFFCKKSWYRLGSTCDFAKSPFYEVKVLWMARIWWNLPIWRVNHMVSLVKWPLWTLIGYAPVHGTPEALDICTRSVRKALLSKIEIEGCCTCSSRDVMSNDGCLKDENWRVS